MNKRETIVSASLLACNLANLESEIRRCERAGVDWIHFDVMDGHFVEQITYGAPVLKSVRSVTGKVLDVHLMVENPQSQIKFFADAGADLITIHLESKCDISGCLREIRSLGKKSALAIKPATPVEQVFDYIPLCDMILVMTVEPGYGGQGFIYDMLPKLKVLREYADKNGLKRRSPMKHTPVESFFWLTGRPCSAAMRRTSALVMPPTGNTARSSCALCTMYRK